jgi:two-component system response regulator AtoC
MEAHLLLEAREESVKPSGEASPLRSLSDEGWTTETARLRARRDLALAQVVPADGLLESAGMMEVLRDARRLAGISGAPMLLQGERGTGLLELARYVHEQDLSTRNGQFRVMASRFVGQPTPFAKAKSGTLLIEDVEELTPAGQEWLTNLLTNRPGGERRFRIIAASRLGVGELMEHSSLGQELVLMLDVGRIVVPPLRERRADVMELAERFLRHCAAAQRRLGLRFSAKAQQALVAHSYPGNVRELRSIVERAVALEPSEEVQRTSIVFHEDLHDHGARRRGAAQAAARRILEESGRRQNRLPSLSEVEREYLVMLIRELGGKRVDISRVMGVSYHTVLKKIAMHGLTVRSILAGSPEP